MTLLLGWDDYEQLWSEVQEIPVDPWDPCDQRILYPESLGSGYSRNISLRNDIFLTLHEFYYHKDVQWRIPSGDENCVELIFNVASPYQRADGVWIQSGQHYVMSHLQHEDLLMTGDAKQLRQAVDIHITTELLWDILHNQLDRFPSTWQKLSQGIPGSVFLAPQVTTPAMQMILHQILNCPFQGVTKQLFLESKSLELLALQLESLLEKDPYFSIQVESIQSAREILDQQLTDPPSLMELARLVGLNERSLKLGFRQVLDTTVFGYVHQQRMEQARKLLGSRNLSVWQVALAVGYASNTSFSKAFRNHFGITPKKYQMQQSY